MALFDHRQVLGLLVQARVLDCDRHLVGDGGCQAGMLLRVEVWLFVHQAEQTGNLVSHYQWDSNPGMGVSKSVGQRVVGRFPQGSRQRGIPVDIIDHDHFLLPHHLRKWIGLSQAEGKGLILGGQTGDMVSDRCQSVLL